MSPASAAHIPATRAVAEIRVRRVQRADPDLPPLPPATYPSHQIGAPSAELIICLAAIIIPGQSGTYRHPRDRVAAYSRNRV